MKKWFLLFFLVCLSTDILGQQCRYSSAFLELYSTDSSLFFVQTKNKEQMMKLKEKVSKTKDGSKIIATLAENAVIVNSKSLGAGNYISEIYQDKEGLKLIMLPRFAIKMKSGHDIEEVLLLFRERLSLDKKAINVYKVDCDVDNAEDVLAINSEINMLESVEWCEPMMIGEGRKCNEYAGYQYYIKNTGQTGGTAGIDINVERVWNFLSANTSLIVAVLDDGVERNHEDLSGVVLNGMTIDYPNEYGDPINQYSNSYYNGTCYNDNKAHGTACAGIIAAKDNDKGIKGVASGVKILPVNIDPYPYPLPATYQYPTLWFEKIGDAITWAYDTKGTDIISCSWNFSYNSYIANALNNAMTYGRNGKGTIVVCCSGNYPSYGVRFPANMTRTIAVGAIDKHGNVWNYSGGGDSLDLVAPSGFTDNQGDVVTTDRSAPYGYNPTGKYTLSFGGTSAACPQVAGVVALMLSANPSLTVDEVKNILHNTARKLPGMNGQNRTDAYGYGLVNAYKAVYEVAARQIVGSHLVDSYEQYDIENIPSGVTVSWHLSDSYYNNGYNLLIQNYPTTGHCLIIRDHNHDMIDATLTAEIKNNGVTVQTLTKTGIYAYAGFKGHYTSAVGSGNLTGGINSGIPFYVKPNWTYYITSQNFYGATVTYDSGGATPSIWGFSPTYGDLTVTTNTSIPVLINVDDVCGNHYQLVALLDNTPATCFAISHGDNGITVTLNEDGDYERGMNQDLSWTIEVRNATTGQLMDSQSSTSRSETISTTGWPKGIYIVKVTIGKNVFTEKVIVR